MFLYLAGRGDPKIAKVHTAIVTPGLAGLIHHLAIRELNMLVIGAVGAQDHTR